MSAEDVPLFKYRWRHRGLTAEGNEMKLDGEGVAADRTSAIEKTDKMLRKQFPNVVWYVSGLQVQINRTPIKKKQNHE